MFFDSSCKTIILAFNKKYAELIFCSDQNSAKLMVGYNSHRDYK
jgi:hypothetical protein